MLLVLKNPVQPPGDPEDHAGEKKGQGIRGEKTEAG